MNYPCLCLYVLIIFFIIWWMVGTPVMAQDDLRVLSTTAAGSGVKVPRVGHILRQIRIELHNGEPPNDSPQKIMVKPANGPAKQYRLHRAVNIINVKINLVSAGEGPVIDTKGAPATVRCYYSFVDCEGRKKLRKKPAWLT